MISKQQAIESFRPELLSPVGTWENLRAAVENGADGVYLGTKEFNARINARNFTLEELGKVVNPGIKAGKEFEGEDEEDKVYADDNNDKDCQD